MNENLLRTTCDFVSKALKIACFITKWNSEGFVSCQSFVTGAPCKTFCHKNAERQFDFLLCLNSAYDNIPASLEKRV